jgi:hypothetical protein
MSRKASFVALAAAFLGVALILATTAADAASSRKKRKPAGYSKEYGFLPGYKEVRAERLRAERWGTNPYWYGGSGFYRGVWNGGGFGPCWTRTPIGMVWNCGR